MISAERHKLILDYLGSHAVAATDELCSVTGASLSTIRRDLNQLHSQGLLLRTHGGAKQIEKQDSVRTEPDLSELPSSILRHTEDPSFALKTAIARRACSLIESGDTIFVGAGLTCNLLCRFLNHSEKGNLTVVTTNVTAVLELADNPNVTTLLLGGTIHTGANHIETLDEYTLQSLGQYYFSRSFFTVDGVDLTYGYSIINRAQLPLYHHLLENSTSVYLLADETKFDRRTFTHLGKLDAIPNVITTRNISARYLDFYQNTEVQLIIS
jgi:DeoR/GlpR family transcriptional regulator of sugar metabolism